jgi:NAD(P)-dependent dehydrogenase (short-subunit alcohol dehydrogenase family)
MADIMTYFNISGRVVIVTGGPGLLGKEFCRTLTEAGCRDRLQPDRSAPAGVIAWGTCSSTDME